MTNHPYSQKELDEPFDWSAFLQKTEFTPKETEDAFFLSGSWVTCACGNQCDVIPRDFKGEPEDCALHELGMVFYRHIRGMNIITRDDREDHVGLTFEQHRVKAIATLRLIESRAQFLIDQIGDANC